MHEVGIEMQDMPVQQWVPRIVVPLGFALLALRFGQAFVRLWRGESARLLSDEAEEALKLRDGAGVPLGEVRE
jgi:C4-dicarboxylate transporter DctQ subunit